MCAVRYAGSEPFEAGVRVSGVLVDGICWRDRMPPDPFIEPDLLPDRIAPVFEAEVEVRQLLSKIIIYSLFDDLDRLSVRVLIPDGADPCAGRIQTFQESRGREWAAIVEYADQELPWRNLAFLPTVRGRPLRDAE